MKASFTDLGIATPIRLLAAALDEPGQWTNIDTGDTGDITPFGRTAFAAESVYRGHRVAATREDILAEFTADPNPAPILHDDPTDSVEDAFETLTAVITGTDLAHHHPDLASRLAVLLADVQLRDVAILISLDHAEPAAALWTQLANQLTGKARLDMLTIAAGAYYAAYDTVRAGIALDIAADEAAAQRLDFPRLASMLLAALNIGMPPEKVRTSTRRGRPPRHLTVPPTSGTTTAYCAHRESPPRFNSPEARQGFPLFLPAGSSPAHQVRPPIVRP